MYNTPSSPSHQQWRKIISSTMLTFGSPLVPFNLFKYTIYLHFFIPPRTGPTRQKEYYVINWCFGQNQWPLQGVNTMLHNINFSFILIPDSDSPRKWQTIQRANRHPLFKSLSERVLCKMKSKQQNLYLKYAIFLVLFT